MKKFNSMHEDHFLALFFTYFSLSFLIAAFFMPDRSDRLPGLERHSRTKHERRSSYQRPLLHHSHRKH